MAFDHYNERRQLRVDVEFIASMTERVFERNDAGTLRFEDSNLELQIKMIRWASRFALKDTECLEYWFLNPQIQESIHGTKLQFDNIWKEWGSGTSGSEQPYLEQSALAAKPLCDAAASYGLMDNLRSLDDIKELKSTLEYRAERAQENLERLSEILERSVTQKASEMLDGQAKLLLWTGVGLSVFALALLGRIVFYGSFFPTKALSTMKNWQDPAIIEYGSHAVASLALIALLVKGASICLHNAFLSYHRAVTLRRLNELTGKQIDSGLLAQVVPAAAKALFDIQPTGFFKSSARAQANSSGISVSYDNSSARE